LEEEHLSLLAERLEMTNRRRRDDDEDDVSLFLHLPPPKPVETEKQDEFGRTLPKGPHAPTRDARRTSRLARFAASSHIPSSAPIKLALTADDESGYVTDGDLMPADLEDFNLAKDKLGHRVASLLNDVRSAEFRDPSLGLAVRFAEWRERWFESYGGAWGGLGMIGAWEFWARLEMAEWNPVEVCGSPPRGWSSYPDSLQLL
jgi:GC-rich sequence DNA-binding factor